MSDGGADGGVRPLQFALPVCPQANQAPIPNGMPPANNVAQVECTTVGADETTVTTGEWPDTAGLSAPILYVRAGAPGTGDGTMAMPFGTIDAALAAMPRANSIVLSRGVHTLANGLALTASVTLKGVGAAGSGTRIIPPAASIAIHVSGAGTMVRVAGVSLQFSGSSGGDRSMERGFLADTSGTLQLDHVVVENAFTGIESSAATLVVNDTTVRGAQRYGVFVGPETVATLGRIHVAGGMLYGIVARNSHVEVRSGYVHDNVRDGIAILGNRGMPSVVQNVASHRNGVTAMRVENGGSVMIERVSLGGTVVPAGTVGGDGLFVGPGSTGILDPSSMGMRGAASQLVNNYRTGILVDGLGASISATGPLLASNTGPGVFVQQHAVLQSLGRASILDNSSLGIGISSNGSAVSILDNSSRGTRVAALQTLSGSYMVGDGISIAEAPGAARAMVANNEIADNERFGVVVTGSNVQFMGNTGTGNRFGIGAYGSDTGASDLTQVGGIETAPTAPPQTARGAVDLTRQM